MPLREHKHINDVTSFEPLGYLNIWIHQTNKLMPKYTKWCSIRSVLNVLLPFFLLLLHKTKQTCKKHYEYRWEEYVHINDVTSFEPLEYINSQIHQTNKLMPEYTKWCSIISKPNDVLPFFSLLLHKTKQSWKTHYSHLQKII